MNTTQVQKELDKAFEAGIRRDYQAALGILTTLISETEEPLPEAQLLLGRTFHALGEYPRALASFRDYIRLKPKSLQGFLFAGRTYLSLGMPQQAVPLLKRAYAINSEDTQILALLGLACLRSRRSREAVEYLEKAVQKDPGNTRIYKAYLNALMIRGIKLCRNDNTELGTQMLKFVLENGIKTPLVHLELAKAYRDSGQLPQALDHYEHALSLSPNDMTIRWYRTSLLMALGKNEEARSELHTLQMLGAELPDVSWNAELVDRFMIRSFLEDGTWRRAAEACGAWLRKWKSDPQIHAMYAEALRNLGDFESARNHLEKAVSMAPDQVELRYAQIILAWEDEDWEHLDKLLVAASRHGGEPVILNRFRALRSAQTNDNDKQVISILQSAIRESGPVPELMYALGERYLKLGLADLAQGWFIKTRQVEPSNERAYLGELAALEVQVSEDSEEAIEELRTQYQEYLQRWPDNISIRRECAIFLINNELYDDAAIELEALLAWEPSNPSLRRLLAYAYRKTERYREAAVLLKGLLKETPKNLSLLLEFTGCLEHAGADNYAAAVLEKALYLFPKSYVLSMKLGDILYKRKHTEAALNAYREAAARNAKDPRPYYKMSKIYLNSGSHEQAERYKKEAERREKL